MSDIHVRRHDDMPSCSRCDEMLAIQTNIPTGEETVLLELCPVCDAGDGVAGRLVEQLMLPAEEKSVDVLGDLLSVWIREAMAARGWHWRPDVEPPRVGLLEDERSAAVVAAARVGVRRGGRASLN